MSQQTMLVVVVPRFLQFIAELPSVHDLAGCSEGQLRRLWAGLGYYARARNLQRGASHIVKVWDGVFRAAYADWLTVPGCGPYTAAMVASLAFGERVAAVDGNIIRVVSRLLCLGDETWTSAGQNTIRSFVQTLIDDHPEIHPGQVNEGLMELGALLCHKQSPQCQECPVRNDCRAYTSQSIATSPPAKPRRQTEKVALAALVFWDSQRQEVALSRRTSGWLKGTSGFSLPDCGRDMRQGSITHIHKSLQSHFGNVCRDAPAVSHTITHHALRVTPLLVSLSADERRGLTRGDPLADLCLGDLVWHRREVLETQLETSLDRKVWRSVKGLTDPPAQEGPAS